MIFGISYHFFSSIEVVMRFFGVAIIGNRQTHGKGGLKGAKTVAQFAEAGAIWWLEDLYMSRNLMEEMRSCILLGPPKED